MMKEIKGFSKLSKKAKLEWLINAYFDGDQSVLSSLQSYWHNEADIQKLHDEFIENTITNYYLPLGIAPNFKINNSLYCVPMAIEESSVVAAAAKSANFWKDRGGFKAKVINSTKVGHVHFTWSGDPQQLEIWFNECSKIFHEGTNQLTANMRSRGGGIKKISLLNKTHLEPDYYQIEAEFDTVDAMGANFINSCLEEFSKILEIGLKNTLESPSPLPGKLDIIMCILSNYTPNCIVKVEVSCPIEELTVDPTITPIEFAEKFIRAINIANIEPYRATTHNKGVMNGIDAVVLATGNDFRAVEACAHTYASRSGQYKSLTNAEVNSNGIFRFWIELPIAVGTVGGLTQLHPLVKFCHKLLNNPNAEDLMKIIASAGLAQNFGAIRSLVTTGIQKGHMKMHLLNILNQLEATEKEKMTIQAHFENKVVTHKAVVDLFCEIRNVNNIEKLNK
ncbi:MAG: hydroxymethylglutaryl-CoA reductase, degradative [Flavobacteriales bacterium]|nr:hydroxymethylglutaryl-CoA reductase, degradative [Flavobacteriales bacterium]